MKFLSYNLLRGLTITASSENDLFPIDNLYSKRKVQEFRFTGYTSEWVKFYSASGITFDSIIIDNHSLTSSATVHIQANDTDVWTSPSVDITATYADAIAYLWSSDQTYNYVRCTFADPTNTGPISIGMIFLANCYSLNIRHGFSIPNVNTGRVSYRSFDGSFPKISATDKDNIETILSNMAGTISLSNTRQQFGTAWPIYVIVDPDNVTRIKPIYGLISDGVTFIRRRTAVEYWEGSFNVQEVF